MRLGRGKRVHQPGTPDARQGGQRMQPHSVGGKMIDKQRDNLWKLLDHGVGGVAADQFAKRGEQALGRDLFQQLAMAA